jgi:hypothetical protein
MVRKRFIVLGKIRRAGVVPRDPRMIKIGSDRFAKVRRVVAISACNLDESAKRPRNLASFSAPDQSP